MSCSLYQATVPSYLQVLRALAGMLDKARAWCAEKGLPDTALTEAKLADDMWPFAKQVTIACLHAADAVAGVQVGETAPDMEPAPTDLATLQARVAETIALLEAVRPEQLDAIAGNDHAFRFGERRMDFTAADYLLSFALPNFYFHASMAYAILRNQGLDVGKRDFLGTPRLKAPATS